MSKRLGELWATVPTNEKYVSTYTHLIFVQEHVFRNFTYHKPSNTVIYQIAALHSAQWKKQHLCNF